MPSIPLLEVWFRKKMKSLFQLLWLCVEHFLQVPTSAAELGRLTTEHSIGQQPTAGSVYRHSWIFKPRPVFEKYRILVWGQSHLGLLWQLESFYPRQAPLCCLCPALQLQQQRLPRGSHAHRGAGRAPQPGQDARCCFTSSPCKHPSNTADGEQSGPGAQALCRYLVSVSAGARALSRWCIHILVLEFLSGSFRVLSVAVLFGFGWVGISSWCCRHVIVTAVMAISGFYC